MAKTKAAGKAGQKLQRNKTETNYKTYTRKNKTLGTGTRKNRHEEPEYKTLNRSTRTDRNTTENLTKTEPKDRA